MTLEITHDVLQRLKKATLEKKIIWWEDDNDWFSTTISNQKVSCRFLYFEATNQPGADRHAVQLFMPGMSSAFACGTLGYALISEMLAANFNWRIDDTAFAGRFLDEAGL